MASNRSLPPLNQHKQTARSSSIGLSPQQERILPTLQLSKILRKIGAKDRNTQMFIPNQQDQYAFRKSKWAQLKKQYSPIRYSNYQPYQGQLDQIVLDCWKHGQNLKTDRRSVWRQYRQNCDELTFDTLKVVRKKK